MNLIQILLRKYLNEEIYLQGGVILIYGKPLNDNTRRLYVTTVKQLAQHNRFKKGNLNGKPNRNITIDSQIYRLSIVDDKLKANGVSFPNEFIKNNTLGIQGNNLGLNFNKTPIHQQTLQFNNISQMINKLHDSIVALPNVKWQG